MKQTLFFLGVILTVAISHAKTSCDVKVYDGNTEIKQSVSFDSPAEVIILPDNTITTDENALNKYIEDHKVPGVDYESDDVGFQNQMNLVDGTYMFLVEDNSVSSTDLDLIQHISMHKLEKETATTMGPLTIAGTSAKEPSQYLNLFYVDYKTVDGNTTYKSLGIECEVK